MPSTKLNSEPNAKLALANARSSTSGSRRVSMRQKNSTRGDRGDHAAPGDGLVLEPVPAIAFLQHVFQRAEEQRHQRQADQVEAAAQRPVGLVDVEARPHRARHDQPDRHVDQEQPVPRVAARSASRRVSGRWSAPWWRSGRSAPTSASRFSPGNSRKVVANTVGIIAPPMKPCAARNTTISPRLEAPAQAQREQREAERAGDEQHARGQQARQPAGQRDHDDLGDQVAGLHPGRLVRAGGQAGLDVGDRGARRSGCPGSP